MAKQWRKEVSAIFCVHVCVCVWLSLRMNETSKDKRPNECVLAFDTKVSGSGQQTVDKMQFSVFDSL